MILSKKAFPVWSAFFFIFVTILSILYHEKTIIDFIRCMQKEVMWRDGKPGLQ